MVPSGVYGDFASFATLLWIVRDPATAGIKEANPGFELYAKKPRIIAAKFRRDHNIRVSPTAVGFDLDRLRSFHPGGLLSFQMASLGR
jgi:hypothetical protein